MVSVLFNVKRAIALLVFTSNPATLRTLAFSRVRKSLIFTLSLNYMVSVYCYQSTFTAALLTHAKTHAVFKS